jgi:2-beta-glucuronyltransferase
LASHFAGKQFNMHPGVILDRALVFTAHFPDAKRKASIHALCEALRRREWMLDFVTVGHSLMSRFNSRSQWPHVAQRPVNEWIQIALNLSSFVWRAPFHPVNLRYALPNKIVTPIYRMYPRLVPDEVLRRVGSAKLILFEGPVSIMLMGMIRAMAPDAVLMYNAADRPRTVGAHPLLCRLETEYAPLLDLVRVPAQVMTADYPRGTPVIYIPHGLDKASFSNPARNPFSTPRNALSIGDCLFDAQVLDTLAEAYPDWSFHLFGVGAVPAAPKKNLTFYGEEAFDKIIPYLQHADIGLAPFRYSNGAEYLSQSSLKMIQYTYCQLPIVTPAFAASGRDHACSYELGDTRSMCDAFARAIRYDRSSIVCRGVPSWDDVLDQMLEKAFATREERSAHAARARLSSGRS